MYVPLLFSAGMVEKIIDDKRIENGSLKKFTDNARLLLEESSDYLNIV